MRAKWTEQRSGGRGHRQAVGGTIGFSCWYVMDVRLHVSRSPSTTPRRQPRHIYLPINVAAARSHNSHSLAGRLRTVRLARRQYIHLGADVSLKRLANKEAAFTTHPVPRGMLRRFRRNVPQCAATCSGLAVGQHKPCTWTHLRMT